MSSERNTSKETGECEGSRREQTEGKPSSHTNPELVPSLQGARLSQLSAQEGSHYTEGVAGLRSKGTSQTNGEGGIFYHEDEFLRGDGGQDSAKVEGIL
ncbi:transcript variant X2 [Nothobranchius furzeri]|uniref:Transcript variant X2 n=1 Tax=Nothobranchius furzeri TaxID=105023 RepID=A0A9D2Y076_NOTFU|nr:transcript variant X2 [Nothobranchius furzeri]